MKKQEIERSGVARCQKCFKYGHLTYQCKNEAAYRYRPSRTIQYKQKLKLMIKSTKPPKVNVVNPDYKRRVVEDGPSSDSNEPQQQQQEQEQQQKLKKQEKQKQVDQPELQQNIIHQQVLQEEQNENASSSSSSQSSVSSSSSQSSSDSDEQPAPRKKKNL